MSQGLWIAVAVLAALVVIAALVIGLVRYRRRRISLSGRPEPGAIDRSGGYTASSGITFSRTQTVEDRLDTSGLPAVGDDATIPRDAPRRTVSDIQLPEPETLAPPPAAPPAAEAPEARPEAAEAPPAPEAPEAAEIEAIAPPEGRLERLRGRLARSQNALGRSVLGLIGGGDLDEESWQDVEDTLLVADLGPVVAESVIAQLRGRLASDNVRTEADARPCCATC